ncbi:MAG: CocE/NonD family hydrolase, partial [Myxococcales bacterium]
MSAPASARRRSRLLAPAFVLGLLLLAAPPSVRHLRAAAMLTDLAGRTPAALALVRFDVHESEPALEGGVRARLYLPSRTTGRSLVLAHGVHRLGIDEPRLVTLARAFARSGVAVLTPQLDGLADYRIEAPENLRALHIAVRWLSERDESGGRVGLMGVSFGGGLALRVAAEEDVAPRLRFVASLGGHHDLARVARFFATGRIAAPDGDLPWTPHDYGVAVLAYDAAEAFVGAEDAPAFRAAVAHFLANDHDAASRAGTALQGRAAALFTKVQARDVAALAPAVLASLPALRPAMDAASPRGRIAAIGAPLFLLHGATDTVVPPSESRWVAHEAGDRAELLVTPLIGHAELGRDAL